VLGATILVASSLVPLSDALTAIAKGTDVYLFLAGMMLLAELARQNGVFAWLAALAARHAKGSAPRLFALVFIIGTIVTIFLSNDATAVVLTPAVYAIVKAAGAEAMPYLFVCAFIANAASFALPISNPANLVVFAGHMPPLASWLATFTLPSALAILATFVTLRLTQRASLRRPLAGQIDAVSLSRAGRIAGCGIVAAITVMLASSALSISLGLPTFLAGAVTAATVLALEWRTPLPLLKGVTWSVLPLVAGLFVLVEGLVRTGVVPHITDTLRMLASHSPSAAGWIAGAIAALASNLMNNLPVGLITGSTVRSGALPPHVINSLLIGVDLGPNLSVTGSLATILWLVALRREGHHVSAWQFLRVGVVLTLPALAVALAALMITAHDARGGF
jgi:arsenical pump membrane protein